MERTEDKLAQVEYTQYKHHPIIRIPDGSQFGVSFGLRKAKAIVEHIESIKTFIKESEAK